jgi:hypothetical protein
VGLFDGAQGIAGGGLGCNQSAQGILGQRDMMHSPFYSHLAQQQSLRVERVAVEPKTLIDELQKETSDYLEGWDK